MSDEDAGAVAAAIAFGHQLDQEEFRRYLRLNGMEPGITVICLPAGAPWDPDRRLYEADLDEALFARQDPDALCGWLIRRHRNRPCHLLVDPDDQCRCACEAWESCIRGIEP